MKEDTLEMNGATLKVAVFCLLPLLALPVSSAPLMPSLLLFACLWSLTVYDWLTFRLPNLLTALFFAAGLLHLYILPPVDVVQHLIGAVVGLFFFPLLNMIYRLLRGRDGVGMGDAKLLAGIGLWLGWLSLPYVLLVASFAGLIYAVFAQMFKNDRIAAAKIPFGPFLSLGCWTGWLYF